MKPSPAYRGWPQRGRVWRRPGRFYRTARKYVTPHIRLGLRQATFSPGRRLWIVRTFSTYRPSSGRNNDSGHLPPGEGIPQKGRHTSATSDRTPPPSALKGSHLPLHAGSHTPRRFCVWNLSGRGMPPPLHAKTILRPAPTPALLSSLFSLLLLK